MRSLIRRLVNDAAEPFERLSAQFVTKGALFALGVFCLGMSLVFFTVALNEWLKSLGGTEIASLGIGVAYLGLGLILLVPIRAASRKSGASSPKPEVPNASGE